MRRRSVHQGPSENQARPFGLDFLVWFPFEWYSHFFLGLSRTSSITSASTKPKGTRFAVLNKRGQVFPLDF